MNILLSDAKSHTPPFMNVLLCDDCDAKSHLPFMNVLLCDVTRHTPHHECIAMWCKVSHSPSWMYCCVMQSLTHPFMNVLLRDAKSHTPFMNVLLCDAKSHTPFMNVLLCDAKSHTPLHECIVVWCKVSQFYLSVNRKIASQLRLIIPCIVKTGKSQIPTWASGWAHNSQRFTRVWKHHGTLMCSVITYFPCRPFAIKWKNWTFCRSYASALSLNALCACLIPEIWAHNPLLLKLLQNAPEGLGGGELKSVCVGLRAARPLLKQINSNSASFRD